MWKHALVAACAGGTLLVLGACGAQSADPASGPDSAGKTSTTGTSASAGSKESEDDRGGTIPVARLTDIVGTYDAGNLEQSPEPIVAGSRLRLQVLDRSITLTGGCNTMSGPAHVEDSHLVIDGPGLAATEMACEQALMDQDAWLADRLTQRPRLDRSGPYLALVWGNDWIGFALAEDQILPGQTPPAPDKPVTSGPTTEPGPS